MVSSLATEKKQKKKKKATVSIFLGSTHIYKFPVISSNPLYNLMKENKWKTNWYRKTRGKILEIRIQSKYLNNGDTPRQWQLLLHRT